MRKAPVLLAALVLGFLPSSAAPAGSAPIFPKFECMGMGCPHTVLCDGSICVTTDCGAGGCPGCPEEYRNLVIKAWCAYGCMKGEKRTGEALLLLTKPFNTQIGPICL
jgi:hypothetical protein